MVTERRSSVFVFSIKNSRRNRAHIWALLTFRNTSNHSIPEDHPVGHEEQLTHPWSAHCTQGIEHTKNWNFMRRRKNRRVGLPANADACTLPRRYRGWGSRPAPCWTPCRRNSQEDRWLRRWAGTACRRNPATKRALKTSLISFHPDRTLPPPLSVIMSWTIQAFIRQVRKNIHAIPYMRTAHFIKHKILSATILFADHLRNSNLFDYCLDIRSISYWLNM